MIKIKPRTIETDSYQLIIHKDSIDHWPIYTCEPQVSIYYFKNWKLKRLWGPVGIDEWKI